MITIATPTVRHLEAAQEYLFSLGCTWQTGDTEVRYLSQINSIASVTADDGLITYSSGISGELTSIPKEFLELPIVHFRINSSEDYYQAKSQFKYLGYIINHICFGCLILCSDGENTYYGEPQEGSEDITPQRCIAHNRALYAFGSSSSIDVPHLGYAVMYFPDNYTYKQEISLLLDYGIIELNPNDINNPYQASKYITKNHSETYDAYQFDHSIKGAKLWQGDYTTSTLNMFKFFQNRLNDKKRTDELMEKLNKLRHKYDVGNFMTESSLIRGYDETDIDSCMRGNGKYFKNFEDAGSLLCYKDDEFTGRAIIWHKEYLEGLPEDCQGFMDRIYPSQNHKVVAVFKEYAKNHGLMYKQAQNYDNREVFVFKDRNLNLGLDLRPPKAGSSDYYPYMDTFRYSEDLRTFNNYKGDYEMCETTGNHSEQCRCENCGDSISEDDARYCGDHCYCEDCFYNEHEYCTHCGEAYERDDTYRTADDYVCHHCAYRRGYAYCEDTEDYQKDYVRCEDTELCYMDTGGLYMAYDTDEFYEYSYNLYYTEDTERYYASKESLYYTEDTNEYYECVGDLHEVNGLFYKDEPEEEA